MPISWRSKVVRFLLLCQLWPLSHPRRPALALFTVALPLARPTPRPLVPLLLNMGAFLSMSGTIMKRTWEPRMYTWSRCDTRPSRAVAVMSLSCTFMLSSAAQDGSQPPLTKPLQNYEVWGSNIPSSSLPRYTCPDVSSSVTTWPCRLHISSCFVSDMRMRAGLPVPRSAA